MMRHSFHSGNFPKYERLVSFEIKTRKMHHRRVGIKKTLAGVPTDTLTSSQVLLPEKMGRSQPEGEREEERRGLKFFFSPTLKIVGGGGDGGLVIYNQTKPNQNCLPTC
jgi:hypothetical protein